MMRVRSISAGSHHAAMVDELNRWDQYSHGPNIYKDTKPEMLPKNLPVKELGGMLLSILGTLPT